MKKIILDVFGGDKPEEVIKGGIDAIAELKDTKIVFAGNKNFISNELRKYRFDKNCVEILHAESYITNDESPTMSIKREDASMVVALNALKSDKDALGLLSCGNSGALLAGGLFKIGRLKGIERPALNGMLPTSIENKTVIITDCGANIDCRPEYLYQFAVMADAYLRYAFKIENPKIALLSNGTEDKKGNLLTKETFDLLKNSGLNFAGNAEARDILSGKYDIFVADGFAGNVALKAVEGAGSMVGGVLKSEIKQKFRYKIGALFLKGALNRLKKLMDYHMCGGAPLLGLQKIIVKSHGSANAKAIRIGISQIKKMTDCDLIEKIKQGISKV
ncbi:MAG: phosphate acyltransferase PlsX [Firmicutes bacterium]|nr:phosphate acyltransferase PlsX [Bacillota bacterium]